MDAGTELQSTDEDMNDLKLPFPHAQYDQPLSPPHNTEWLAPPGPPPTLRRNRRVDVSIDTKTLSMQGYAAQYDEEGVPAYMYIPAWVLQQEDLDNFMAARVGVAPGIIYARGVLADPTPDRLQGLLPRPLRDRLLQGPRLL